MSCEAGVSQRIYDNNTLIYDYPMKGEIDVSKNPTAITGGIDRQELINALVEYVNEKLNEKILSQTYKGE